MEVRRHRLGLIEVPDSLWSMSGDQIKKNLIRDGGKIQKIVQALAGPGRYKAAQAVILTHPEFEEVEELHGSPITKYHCEFSNVDGDGSLKRSSMIRIDQDNGMINRASAS
ncbi:MAG: hypothetical protein ACKVQW_08285 [Pyrinomonadaceae bacterium]